MPKISKDITGRVFSSLTVIRRSEKKTSSGRELWECKCKCGNIKLFRAFNLLSGKTHSCSCETKERFIKRMWKGVGKLGQAHWGHILRSAKRRRGNIPVKISIQDAWEQFQKQNGKCALSGESIWFTSSYAASDGVASLDRIDSSKGYEFGNIQWVHKDINQMKWQLSQEKFIEWCKKISNHRNSS